MIPNIEQQEQKKPTTIPNTEQQQQTKTNYDTKYTTA